MTEKLPKGIELNGNQLRISFMLNGQRCREPISGIAKINKARAVAGAECNTVIELKWAHRAA